MGFDEFSTKLRIIKAEYLKIYNQELKTLDELEKFLDRKLIKSRSKSLKSLKGLNL